MVRSRNDQETIIVADTPGSMRPTVTFQGAARTVTGSMHIVAHRGDTVLLDCGTFHGRREESRRRNSTFPFDPSTISAVVLSHAHIDHSGNLPTLVKQGFRGRIFATPATMSLCQVMLKDSAHIQERDAEFVSKKHRKKGLPPVTPLYTQEDVEKTLPLFSAIPYSTPFEVTEHIRARFEDAGHILGSASVSLTLQNGATGVHLGFTGDLGRPGLPILRDPVFIGDGDAVDYLICESTYGGRRHAPVSEMQDQLLDPFRRACERGGKIVIPAFSVGRTQELVYCFHRLIQEGKIEEVPMFVDSPLSVNVTDVFRQHPECFDRETWELIRASEDQDAFGFERLTYIRDVEESKELNERKGPFVVIAASGMCEAGRVVHHLAHAVSDPRAMIMIVGYQAEHTLGRKLVTREPTVSIFGEPRDLRAEVVVLDSFSAHADRNELLDYVQKFSPAALRGVFLVHGDPEQAGMLEATLERAGFNPVQVPARGDRVELNGR
jgi:metallo-beta-lactamase family protein